ncbi:MAG: hypothetical protein RL553_263 [Planctomycetota bacterium]|jgi:hypothetical protein
MTRVPNIAVIGTEGSGKTVLITTLAKRLSVIDSRGIFFNPKDSKTLKYVEKVWSTLQSEKWPPSTPPGDLFSLAWKLEIVGEFECDLRLVDTAGQDLRILFGDDQIYSLESLPSHLQDLARYCRESDIILFPINLKDYLGQDKSEQRTANEAAMKAAMDYLESKDGLRKVCLVFTQSDLYQDYADKLGGWSNVAAEAFPYIYGAHVHGRKVEIIPVSAVAKTKVVVDKDGTPRRVPVEGFQSEGLDNLVNWLIAQVKKTKREEERKVGVEEWDKIWGHTKKAFIVILVVVGLIIIGKIIYFYKDEAEKARAAEKAKIEVERQAQLKMEPKMMYGFWTGNPGSIWWDSLTVKLGIMNPGSRKDIKIIILVKEKGNLVDRKDEPFYLEENSQKDFEFEMKKISSLKNPIEVSVWVTGNEQIEYNLKKQTK